MTTGAGRWWCSFWALGAFLLLTVCAQPVTPAPQLTPEEKTAMRDLEAVVAKVNANAASAIHKMVVAAEQPPPAPGVGFGDLMLGLLATLGSALGLAAPLIRRIASTADARLASNLDKKPSRTGLTDRQVGDLLDMLEEHQRARPAT